MRANMFICLLFIAAPTLSNNEFCYSQGPCDAGYLDSTNNNYNYWQCGSGCVGGKYYATNGCGCACIEDVNGDGCFTITPSPTMEPSSPPTTNEPTQNTDAPTFQPSSIPTNQPTDQPTQPSSPPTTAEPTSPTSQPTRTPTFDIPSSLADKSYLETAWADNSGGFVVCSVISDYLCISIYLNMQ